MALILDSHSGVKVADEDHSYRQILGGYEARKDLLPGFKIPNWTRRIRLIRRKFPRASFIFMKRDIRSVTASMLSLQFGGKSWAELHGISEIERTIPAITDSRRRAFFHRAYVEKIDLDHPVTVAALCAYLKLSLIDEYHRAGAATLEVAYEELVLRPALTISAVLEFLELPWQDAVMNHSKGQHGMAIGSTDRARPIDSTSVQKWRQILTREDLARIDVVVAMGREYDADADSTFYHGPIDEDSR